MMFGLIQSGSCFKRPAAKGVTKPNDKAHRRMGKNLFVSNMVLHLDVESVITVSIFCLIKFFSMGSTDEGCWHYFANHTCYY